MQSIDQQFIEFIVKSLVGKPDAVHVERRIDEKGVLLELTVDPEDLGRVIGKRGVTAQSLRTLLRALGTKNDARYNLKIVDNGEPAPASIVPTNSSDENDAADDSQTTKTDFTSDEDSDPTAEEDLSESSVVTKTRKELADLDDLDV
ncbi:MAG TPA: KH domain-containing protein [Candidatus Saccharimonadales bacterium]